MGKGSLYIADYFKADTTVKRGTSLKAGTVGWLVPAEFHLFVCD